MFTHARYLEEYGRDRVDTLRREAERMRLLHRCRQSRVSPLERLLFCTGGWLVRCGDWLQQRYAASTSIEPHLG